MLEFLDRNGLAGSGLGWIDVHLFASARLGGIGIWTLGRNLERVATGIGLGF